MASIKHSGIGERPRSPEQNERRLISKVREIAPGPNAVVIAEALIALEAGRTEFRADVPDFEVQTLEFPGDVDHRVLLYAAAELGGSGGVLFDRAVIEEASGKYDLEIRKQNNYADSV